VPGDTNYLAPCCDRAGILLQQYDISRIDHYALPNLIKTLRTSKFTLLDEIMATPLLTLSDVFKRKEGEA
jgi:hypothetical protein